MLDENTNKNNFELIEVDNVESSRESDLEKRIKEKINKIRNWTQKKTNKETQEDFSTNTEQANFRHVTELFNYNQKLEQEMPQIKEAIAAINVELSDYPILIDILEKYLLDMTHHMNIAEYLKNPVSRGVVIEHLKDLAEQPAISLDEFLKQVNQFFDSTQPFYTDTDSEFSIEEDGTDRLTVMKELLMNENSELYGIGDKPNEREMYVLREHVQTMKNKTILEFQNRLRSLITDFKDGAFPAINGRVKSAEGMIDKVHRMRSGHDKKTPRPEYSIGDMPDAVGCRLTVRKLSELQALMPMIEAEFGKENIFEKENFYSNEKKRERPFRAIAYTILIGGIPCELQLTTLDSSLVGDIHHNIVYKPILPGTEEDKAYCNELRRKTVIKECKEVENN